VDVFLRGGPTLISAAST